METRSICLPFLQKQESRATVLLGTHLHEDLGYGVFAGIDLALGRFRSDYRFG